jgi:hypothetical protein
MIGESSVDRCHVFDKLGVVPLSTKPLHAQERMASEADRRGGIVRHNEIGHGDSTRGIVPLPAKQVKTGRTQGHEVRSSPLIGCQRTILFCRCAKFVLQLLQKDEN